MSLKKKIKKLFNLESSKKEPAKKSSKSTSENHNQPPKSKYVKMVAEKSGRPYDEVYARMSEVKEKYGVSFYIFAKRGFINKSEAQIAAFANLEKKRKESRFEQISQETGVSVDEAKSEFKRIKSIYKVNFKKYFFNRLYLMSEEELAAKVQSWEDEREELITIAVEKSGWERKDVLKQMRMCDVDYGIDRLHYVLFKCWELSEEEIAGYLSIKTSTALTYRYNSEGRKYFINKALFDEKFEDFICRKHWVNEDADFESFQEFTEGLDEIFVKPMASSAGRGAEKIKLDVDLKVLYDDLMSREQIIAEECVKQHEDINRLYPDCVNTIRIITILKDDVCHKVFALIKIGNGGVVDNLVGGGMAAVIDIETGKIITDAVDIRGNIIKTHPVTGTVINGYQLPNWDMLLDTVDRAIRVVPDVNYVGWDVAIGQDKIMIIEGNSRPDLGLCQIPMVQKKEGIKHLFDEFLK